MAPTGLLSLQTRQGHPDFLDLPWHLPLEEWEGKCSRLVEVPRGISRRAAGLRGGRGDLRTARQAVGGQAPARPGHHGGEHRRRPGGPGGGVSPAGLAGIVAEEKQATLLLNEIQELKATLARELKRSTPLSTAAFRWLEERFHPTIQKVQPVAGPIELSELYCQVLEHRWFLSEREKKDVGLQRAIEDYTELRKRQKAPSVALLPPGAAGTPSPPRPQGISEGDGKQEPAPTSRAGNVDTPSGGH